MEKKNNNQNLKPSFPKANRPAVARVSSKPPEEAKLSKLVPTKLTLNFNNLNTNKPRKRLAELNKISSQLTEEQEIKILQDKIMKNSSVSFIKTLRDLMSKYSKNRNEIDELKNERRLIQSSGEKLELLRGFVISEIEFFLNSQVHEQEEEDFTYEELLELGDRIGKVSKGYSEEKIATLKTVPAPTSQSCSICLTAFESRESATLLSPCDHLYHIDCIKSWLLDNKTCPLCLQEIIL